MRRVISLWLPNFATDRPTRPRAALATWRERPLATLTEAHGGLRVAAANAAAQGAGIIPGMAAADARAVFPDVKTAPAQPEADARTLLALAEWCERYTPWVAVEGLADGGNAGLWLDVTGCAHLFGGEAVLLDDLAARVDGFGFAARAALADTPGAAWAAARFAIPPGSRTTILPEGAQRQWLSGLPVAALRLPAAALETLRRLGLRRVGDLYSLPRAPLAARFGDIVALRLDQMLGRRPEPLSPRRPVPPHVTRLAFAEPIGRMEDVAAAIRRLLDGLCAGLERDGMGARRLELSLFRVDGTVFRHAVGTSQGVRDAAHLARLFGEGLDKLNAGFGIEAVAMAATSVEALAAAQMGFGKDRRDDGLPALIDRLTNRLGGGSVFRLEPRPSHLPETAAARAAPLGPWRGLPLARHRPPRLLALPEPVEAEGGDALAAPAAIHWRRRPYRIVRAEGPERIAAEWWHGATPAPPSAHRDYWRIEDTEGRRLWLFRHGRRWFVHGVMA